MDTNLKGYSFFGDIKADKDTYACLKIMEDTSKIAHFFEQINLRSFDTTNICRYYYSINSDFSHLEHDFRIGRINCDRFSNLFIDICTKYDLDLTKLIFLSNRISNLGDKPHKSQVYNVIDSLYKF